MKEHYVADVGNSRVKWGRCDESRVVERVSLPAQSVAWQQQWQRWGKPVGAWTISGSHPPRIDEFSAWLTSHGHCVKRIENYRQLPLKTRVDRPDSVGLDRLLNGLAVFVRSQGKGPAVIIDAGSAVTVDCLDAEGTFCGGAIFPGLRLMAQALHEHTAKLPMVEVTHVKPPPGTNIAAAIEAGVTHAVLGGIEALIQAYEKHFSCKPTLYLGGGDAEFLAPYFSRAVTVWPEMTLDGIRLAGETGAIK